MYNSYIKAFLALTFIWCLCSCCNSSLTNNNSTVNFSCDSIKISNTSNKNIAIYVQNENVFSPKGNSMSYSLLDITRKCKNKRETALSALNNGDSLPIRVVIENELDTVKYYKIQPYFDKVCSSSISGQCAPLVPKFSISNQTVDIKKWLFRKKEHIEDEKIQLLSGLINQLSKTKTTDYITNTTIPVIHSFSRIKYHVNSSIKADYYVLYACSSTKDIDEFVGDIVSSDLELCAKTLSGSMNCYRKSESNGYKCICLIAINKDWSYKIQPLGLIAIDNMAPITTLSSYKGDISSIEFPNNQKVIFPSHKPEINGLCDVSITNLAGNGIECNVSFGVIFLGDVKSVTVKRTKKLCYDSSTHKVENKVISLINKNSPYDFTFMLHLTDGDNYIPIIVEDNHGNKKEFELYTRAEFIRNSSPSINIDNNINIDNY